MEITVRVLPDGPTDSRSKQYMRTSNKQGTGRRGRQKGGSTFYELTVKEFKAKKKSKKSRKRRRRR